MLQPRDIALAPSQVNPARDKVFDVVFSLEFRRTLFGPEPPARALSASDHASRRYLCPALSRHWADPVPTIVQRLTQLSPTLMTSLGSEDHYREACRKARRSIRALCLTGLIVPSCTMRCSPRMVMMSGVPSRHPSMPVLTMIGPVLDRCMAKANRIFSQPGRDSSRYTHRRLAVVAGGDGPCNGDSELCL